MSAPESNPELTAALKHVCDIADSWAGEYGWVIPETATQVYQQVKLIRRELDLDE